jgi:IMP dehydrogenase
MRILDQVGLGYKNISLISRQISTIGSRDDINISVEIFPGCILTTPIITAPMKDVCDWKVAKEIRRLGGIGILHRFCSIKEQLEEYRKVATECICAVGLNDFDRIDALYVEGCRYFCLDVANGANLKVKEALEEYNKYFRRPFWIVGNVVSKEGYKWCQSIKNVWGIRTGVSGGLACSTRSSTGIFHPPVNLLTECSTVKTYSSMIADGGIEKPMDACKAIILGSNAVMLGSLICSTQDSPAEIVERDGKFFKVMHGSSSYDIQKIYKNKPKYIEGKTVLIPYKEETLEELVNRFMQGLRSSMSYFNAKTLDEYRKNIDYIICL